MTSTFIKEKNRKPLNAIDERNNKMVELAESKGLSFGSLIGSGYGKPAISGNTFTVKDILKANGAKWAGANKCWVFETVETVEAALNAIA